jgi:hypothetical protein
MKNILFLCAFLFSFTFSQAAEDPGVTMDLTDQTEILAVTADISPSAVEVLTASDATPGVDFVKSDNCSSGLAVKSISLEAPNYRPRHNKCYFKDKFTIKKYYSKQKIPLINS